MTTLKVDDATFEKLRAAGSVLVVSESGALAGEFRARADLDPSQYLGRWFTDEEVTAHLTDPRRHTATEVEQKLRELRK
jgi:hypothetical protein